ncbi:MAG: TetR/AcrR family transcriptional regulator [Planctomycetota bacterium]|nr:TetR/AcrR family transcriptional regulator [Planctomycetota bacterium]
MSSKSTREQEKDADQLRPIPAQKKRPHKGRPRDEKAHIAIMECALEMARTKNRYRDITIERISQGAKVAKTTIYRWWDSKSDLIHEACFEGQLHDPEACSLREELRNLLNQAYQMHISRATRGVMAGLLAEYIEYSQEHPELLQESVFPFERDLNNILTLIFERGKERGDGPSNFNVRAMAKTVETVLFHNCITYGMTCSEQRMAILMQQVMTASTLPD